MNATDHGQESSAREAHALWATAPAPSHATPAHPDEAPAQPPHDPSLRPTAQAAAQVNQHYADGDDDDDGGFFGSLGRMADRVASTARSVVHAVAPAVPGATAAPAPSAEDGGSPGGLWDRATHAVAAVRETARSIVTGGGEAMHGVADRVAHETERVLRSAEETRNDMVRSIDGTDVGHQLLRVREECQVMQADLGEQIVDLGRAGVDFVEEDLGVGGHRPDVTRPPEAPDPHADITPAEQADARQRAHDVFTATDGLGTDFSAVRAALTGMNPDQIRVMEQEYFQMTHQNLRAVLDLETSGSDEDEVQGLLSGDPVTQAVATLRGATTGCDTEDEVVRSTLRDLSEDERRAVLGQLGQGFFREQLAGTSEEASLARLRGDETAAQAAEVSDALHGGMTGALGRTVGLEGLGADVATAQSVLRELPSTGRDAMEAAVQRRSRTDGIGAPGQEESLDHMIATATSEGGERHLTQAILAGDETGIDAAELALQAEGHWYENPAVITGALMVVCPVAGLAYAAYRLADSAQSGRNPFETADVEAVRSVMARRPAENDDAYRTRVSELRERYARDYGGGDPAALNHMIDEEFTVGSSDHFYLADLADDGVVSPAAQLRYAFGGHLGTNDELAVSALQDEHGNPLPRGRVQEIVAQFNQGGHDLAAEVDGGALAEMSGDQGFEMRELLQGAPETDQERIAAELRRGDWARGTGIARPLVDLTGSQAGLVMDEQGSELVRLRQRLDRVGHLSQEEQIALEDALARHHSGETAYRARVDETTEGVANVAGTTAALAAGIAVDAVTAGAATPVLLAIAAGAAGGLTDLNVRLAMRGARMSNEEIGQRLASTALSAATEPLGLEGVPGALMSVGPDEALQIVTGQRRIENLGDVAAMGGRLAGAAAGSALGDHAAGHISDGTAGGRALRGLTSGAIEGLVEPTLDADTYEHGAEGALRTIGTHLATHAVSGAVRAGLEPHRPAPTQDVTDAMSEVYRMQAEREAEEEVARPVPNS